MSVKVAINGFGRIGRLAFRAMVEQGLVGNDVEVVAVGDLVPADNLAYLLKYDSTQGPFDGEVSHKDDETLVVNGAEIKVVKAPSPAELPWKELGVDVVVESTGLFTDGDLRRLVAEERADLSASIESFMTANPLTLSPDDRVLDAQAVLVARALDQAPVVDEQGRAVGLIDIQDLHSNNENA